MRDQDRSDTTQQTTTTASSYGIPPALLANKVEDKGEFVLIRRGHQSEGFTIYSTVSEEETTSWLQQVTRETEPA